MEFPSDEVLAIIIPIAVYWLYSGIYLLLGPLDNYRLHSREDEQIKNMVSKREVAKGVLLQQLVQACVAFITFTLTRDERSIEMVSDKKGISLLVLARQFIISMVIIDTWQYFWHRYMHLNKFLYRHIHSWHHRIIVNYSFGAQYNHPIEGLLLDTLGGALAFLISGMTPRASIFFFSFATIKGIDDHCGLWLPGNIFHLFFWNNTAYHDVHHQLYGNKYNFSQPFFITWDKIFGTYMPYTLEKREEGGFHAKPNKS
ncbi:sphinganine C4-monooxygenase protein [Dioscorea alata]|uniref:Sphinganine C4-monooxygenase protein n=1 Tax=Dioscorea alata TaxID=55571 RepID=A0ACB7W874_DIOAL|nr:sphinganine C4-monooxygenase protein [Dioscorea alata]